MYYKKIQVIDQIILLSNQYQSVELFDDQYL